MTTDITGADSEHLLDEGWSTPLEAGVRGTIRGFIEALPEEELEAALGRARYARLKTAAGERAAAGVELGNEEGAASAVPSTGHRNGRCERQVLGSFGACGGRSRRTGRAGTSAISRHRASCGSFSTVPSSRFGSTRRRPRSRCARGAA